MTSTNTMRDWWYLYRCNYGTPTNMFGRSPVYAQETAWVRALEQAHVNAGYQHPPDGYIGSRRQCPSGIGGQKCQFDGSGCSLHNYGLAWDIDYQYNPHLRRTLTPQQLDQLFVEGVTRYSSYMVEQIGKVRTTGGRAAFQWLGYSLGDLMHWQFNAPPEDRDIDWSTVGDNQPEEPMTTEQWAKTLRNPTDFDQMVAKGVITAAERDYWIQVPTDSPEFQDLRNAVEVRNPLWTQ